MNIATSCLLIADLVRDSGSGAKKDILGVVTTINVTSGGFPAIVFGLWIYWQAYITDPPANLDVQILVQTPHLDTETVLFGAQATLQEGMMGSIELAQPLPPMTFSDGGVRYIVVRVDGEEASKAFLNIQQVSE